MTKRENFLLYCPLSTSQVVLVEPANHRVSPSGPVQSAPLSLVHIQRDTLLSLVEPYYAGAKVFAITTHRKAQNVPSWGILIALCVVMASMHREDIL